MRTRSAFATPLLLALLATFAPDAAAPLVAQSWTGGSALEVRAEDSRGRNVAGAEVILEYLEVPGLGGPAPVTTDATGRMAIGGLAPGRWSLEVRKPGFMSYRAEIRLAGDAKPEVVSASQHNVPGAVGPMRIRLGRARNAPLARPLDSAPAEAPPPAAPVVAPAPRPAAVATPVPVATPAPAVIAPPAPIATPAPVVTPAPVATPVPIATPAPLANRAPEPAPTPAPIPPSTSPGAPATVVVVPTPVAPAPPAPAASPTPVAAARPAITPVAPAAPVPAPRPSPTAVPTQAPAAAPAQVAVRPATTPPALTPAVAPAAPPSAPTPAPSLEVSSPPAPAPTVAPAPPPTPAPSVTAPPPATAVIRSADGRSLSAEIRIESGGGGCPVDLAARLSLVPMASFEKLTKSLPAGCAVLRIDLPAGAALATHRYEAAAEGELQPCTATGTCPVPAVYFEGAPLVRRTPEGSAVLAIVASSSSAPRRGVLTVELR